MTARLLILSAIFLAEMSQPCSAAEDLDAFFIEDRVWPAVPEDLIGFGYHQDHFFALNGYYLQILKLDNESKEFEIVGSLEFENLGSPTSPNDGLHEIVVLGDRAYIKEQRNNVGGRHWHAVDIGDFANPKREAEPEFGTDREFRSNGKVAVSSTLRESKIYEVEESGELVLRYTFINSHVWGTPRFIGEHLIMQLEGTILTAVDISDLDNPLAMETVHIPGLSQIASWKNYVFNRRTAELEVYDFTIPTEPVQTTTLKAETELAGPPHVFVDYPFLYTAKSVQRPLEEDRSLLEAFNIANPADPRLVGRKEIEGDVSHIAVVNLQLVVVTRSWNDERADLQGQLRFFDLQANDEVDTDRDGVTDVTEFAVGAIAPEVIFDTDGRPAFQYRKSASANPIFDYVVEVSPNLQSDSWQPAPFDHLISAVFANELRNVPLEAANPYARLRVMVKD